MAEFNVYPQVTPYKTKRTENITKLEVEKNKCWWHLHQHKMRSRTQCRNVSLHKCKWIFKIYLAVWCRENETKWRVDGDVTRQWVEGHSGNTSIKQCHINSPTNLKLPLVFSSLLQILYKFLVCFVCFLISYLTSFLHQWSCKIIKTKNKVHTRIFLALGSVVVTTKPTSIKR